MCLACQRAEWEDGYPYPSGTCFLVLLKDQVIQVHLILEATKLGCECSSRALSNPRMVILGYPGSSRMWWRHSVVQHDCCGSTTQITHYTLENSTTNQTPSQPPGRGCSVSLGATSHYGNTCDICNMKFNRIRGCVYSIKRPQPLPGQLAQMLFASVGVKDFMTQNLPGPQRCWQPDTAASNFSCDHFWQTWSLSQCWPLKGSIHYEWQLDRPLPTHSLLAKRSQLQSEVNYISYCYHVWLLRVSDMLSVPFPVSLSLRLQLDTDNWVKSFTICLAFIITKPLPVGSSSNVWCTIFCIRMTLVVVPSPHRSDQLHVWYWCQIPAQHPYLQPLPLDQCLRGAWLGSTGGAPRL